MALDPAQIEKPIRKLRKAIKRMGLDPAPQEVHDLRTNSRRLEATLDALSRDSLSGAKSLAKDLARMRRRAGKVRDMDVLTGLVLKLHVNGESECITQLTEHLALARRKRARRLQRTLAKSGTRTRKALKQISSELLCGPHQRRCDPAASSAEATAAALKLESKLAASNPLGRDHLHPYRLLVKQLRNILRMSDDVAHHEFTGALREVKDAIGEWHDWAELQNRAADILGHGPKCKLLRELKRTTEEKYQQAMTRTEQMRERYFGVGRKRKGKGLKAAAEPVWKATRGLAA